MVDLSNVFIWRYWCGTGASGAVVNSCIRGVLKDGNPLEELRFIVSWLTQIQGEELEYLEDVREKGAEVFWHYLGSTSIRQPFLEELQKILTLSEQAGVVRMVDLQNLKEIAVALTQDADAERVKYPSR